MKVPNKILHIVLKLANGTEQVSTEERDAVRGWAMDGVAKRAALAAQPKPAEVE